MKRTLCAVAFILGGFYSLFSFEYSKPLTFEDRLKAQDAIERVYYNHRVWPKENPQPKPPFEKMVPRTIIEQKVNDSLKISATLKEFWQRPLTGEQLQAEMDRMARNTKDPETLKELFAALDNDPYLIAECLARPVLADRRCRDFCPADNRFDNRLDRAVEAMPINILTTVFENSTGSGSNNSSVDAAKQIANCYYSIEYDAEYRLPPINDTLLPDSPNSWSPIGLGSPEARADHSAIWTGSEMIIWGGGDGSTLYDNGGCYNPVTDTWRNISMVFCPTKRVNHTAIWTGTEMIVWGGWDNNQHYNTGGRYNPVDNSWNAVTLTGAPSPRKHFSAVWTGSEMIVWGGENGVTPLQTGGRYRPSNDTWYATNTDDPDRPSMRSYHTAVWTGQFMLIWGGLDPWPANTGAMYDPTSDAWEPMSVENAPSARYDHTCVWTDSEMVVWGGRDFSSYFSSGGLYNPVSNSWSETPSTGAPQARCGHSAIWNGAVMMVWGGDDGVQCFDGGSKYSPLSNSWAAIAFSNAPTARTRHSAIWTMTEMIVWGGVQENIYTASGGKYDPNSELWTPTAIIPCPSRRTEHTGCWTGAEMIIWGGHDGSGIYTNDGGRYCPATDIWAPTEIDGSPSPRGASTGIWTGEEFVVWGGWNGGTYFGTGGKYDPIQDSWSMISVSDAPSPRKWFSAVWTGTEVIVWGGSNGSSPLYTGGRYNPTSDEWVATDTQDPDRPSFRSLHTAVWDGSEMIVWGGLDPYPTDTGARYRPSEDTWAPVSTSDSPAARYRHSAVWSGEEMIVWGGRDFSVCMASGGKYNPTNDSWIQTTTDESPAQRSDHVAVWNGLETILWGGECDSSFFGDGANYGPSDDIWSPIVHDSWEPSPRSGHVGMWNGEVFLLWGGGTPATNTGGMYFPNTSPRALPQIVSSVGGDAEYAWGTGETVTLTGLASSDGSNPHTIIPYHDSLDSIVSYEWDLNADGMLGTLCKSTTVGIDKVGLAIPGLTDTDLKQYGISGPGTYDIWLRVTDEVGAKGCGMNHLTVVDGIPPTVTLLTPNGGEYWEYSPDELHRRTSQIFWSASDNAEISRVLISYSSDGGSTWTGIIDSVYPLGDTEKKRLFANDSSYEWQMPTQNEAASDGQIFPTSNALVKIQVWDRAGNSAIDISDHQFFIKSPTVTIVKTLIIANSGRLESLYPGQSALLFEKLNLLAENGQVNGVLFDLHTYPSLSDPESGLYHLWDTDPTNVLKANAVADEIRALIKSRIETVYTQAQYLVLVGNDWIIPHHRIVDPIYFSELDYSGEVDCGSTVGSAICANYYLTDNTFADIEYDQTRRGTLFIALPDLATGRLVETPEEMISTIDSFVAQEGQILLNKTLVTGYDFLVDAAIQITNSYLEKEIIVDSLGGTNWTPIQLSAQIFSSPPHAINNLNDHSDHYSIGTPEGPLAALTMDSSNPGAPLKSIVFYNIGCHSGLNVPDTWAPEKHPLDLPQLMLRKGAVAYVGNTGYGWGLKYGVGYSERLMELITDQLLSQQSCALGDALNEAKREYFVQNHRYDVFDEKVLFESTLYGLPMYQVVMGSSLAQRKDNPLTAEGPDYQQADGITMKKNLLTSDETNSLPPGITELTLNFDFGPEVYQKVTTGEGDYYTLNGRSSGEIGDTLQPMFMYNSQLSDTACHGVIFTGGDFTSEGGFVPVVGVPMSNNEDPGSGPIAPGMGGMIGTVGIHKLSLQNSGPDAEKTRMTVYTGYYDEGTQNNFDGIGFVVYYSNSADRQDPVIADPGLSGALHTLNGLVASFSVGVSDSSGVFRVTIAYTDGQGQWKSLDLSYNSTSGRWEGALEVKRNITYFAQAVDNAGNAGILRLTGPDLGGDNQPYGSDYSTSRMFSVTLLDSDGDGMPDPWEIPNGLSPSVNDAAGDPDGDLLTNIEEYNADSDPQNIDSDSDGDNDGSEAHNGRSPIDPLDGKEIAILASKNGSDVAIAWLPATGQNFLIDGPYWVYRSTSPQFLPTDALAGMPLSDAVTELTDGTATGASLYFYTVRNVPITVSPVVDAVAPSSGPVAGGTSVNIYGSNFLAGDSVKIGGNAATNVVVVNDIKITCKTPAGTAGYKDVRVTNPDGKYGTLTGGFRYY